MVRVVRSTIIEAPIDTVWELLRDFNGHDRWHPAVAQSAVEDGGRSDRVGCVRRFRLGDGTELREQLLALSDRERSFRYCILESPIPLLDYVATVELKPVTDGDRTFWRWEGRFGTPPGREAELATMVARDIYEAGMAAVAREFAQPGYRPASLRLPRRPPQLLATASGNSTTRAIVVTRHGGPDVLQLMELSISAPGPGEIRIRHTAIGVNFIDVHTRTGHFPLIEPPAVPGMEAAGVVLATGSGVHGILPGDRVAYACMPPGAYAEERTMAAELVVPLPGEIDDVTGAAALLKGMTVEVLLHRVTRVQEGQAVLVHAAAGGVGLLLCQWARALGATVLGTVGSEAKARLARAHGCQYPILYREDDFVARVAEITMVRGCDIIFDAVGGDFFEKSYAALAVGGHLVSFGAASGPIPPIPIGAYVAKSATVSRPNFAHFTDTRAKVTAITDRLFDAIRRGILRIPEPTRLPLARAADAHRALEARATMGATILLP